MVSERLLDTPWGAKRLWTHFWEDLMGVFETLASLCEPRDLATIRETMRVFLSASGEGGPREIAHMESVARRLMPFEMRYLPSLNTEIADKVGCRSLAVFARSDSRLVPLVAAAMKVQRILLLHTVSNEIERSRALESLQSYPFDVVAKPLRGEPLHQVAARLLERSAADPATGPLAFFPGDAPPGVAVLVSEAARRAGVPVLCAQYEDYHGVLRPFSLRLSLLQDEMSAVTSEPPQPPQPPQPGDPHSIQAQRDAAEAQTIGGVYVAATIPEMPAVTEARLAGLSGTQRAPFPGSGESADFYAATEPAVGVDQSGSMSVPADDLAKLLVSAFNGRNYPAALRIAGHVSGYRDALARFRVGAEILVELVRVYADWDRFRHSPLEDAPSRKLHERLIAAWQHMGTARDQIVSDVELSRNTAFLRKLDASWEPGGRLVGDPCRAVDMFAAALRRRARSLNEEAALFCLRSMQMAATHVLQQEPFVIGDPHRPQLEGLARVLGGVIDMGDAVDHVLREWGVGDTMPGRSAPLNLFVMMAILRAVGEVYREGPALAMGTRFGELMAETAGREPLHAHLVRTLVGGGTAPVPQESGERLEKSAREIVSRAMGLDAFRERMTGATHASLRVPD